MEKPRLEPNSPSQPLGCNVQAVPKVVPNATLTEVANHNPGHYTLLDVKRGANISFLAKLGISH